MNMDVAPAAARGGSGAGKGGRRVPTFTPKQTLFTLSLLPDLGHCYSGSVSTIEAALLQRLNALLPTLAGQIGPWQVVWGPAVYELPSSDHPDNVMLVVQNGGVAGLPDLVVAVAGTNPYSFLDWIVEDFLVSTQVPWPTGNPPVGAAISLATFTGLSVLQTLVPGPGQPGAGVPVRNFLAAQVSGGATAINLGGHSLGGALSPTLALWLHDTRAAWDPQGHTTLSVLPSAGPTAGNQAFATYSDAQIGAQVTRLHNSLDAVPHAWAAADIQELPTLYAPQIKPDPVVLAFAAIAREISKNGGYTQIDAAAPALPGTVNQGEIHDLDLPFVNFFNQAGWQHVDAYYDLLGVPSLATIMACVKSSAPQVTPIDILTRLKEKLAKLNLKFNLDFDLKL